MSKKKVLLIFFLIVFCVGCAAQGTPLLEGVTLQGNPVCLANPEGIPDIVRKFFASRDLTTEEGKIDYLFERMRKSNLTFVRNKVEYDGKSAAEFLRWKMGRMERRYHTKIKTAQDFVSQVASGSRLSGQPYTVILSDGTRHNLQNVLQNELNALEVCLKQYAVKTEAPQPKNSADATPESAPIHQSDMADTR